MVRPDPIMSEDCYTQSLSRIAPLATIGRAPAVAGIAPMSRTGSGPLEGREIAALQRRQIGFDLVDRPVPPGKFQDLGDDLDRIAHPDDAGRIPADDGIGRHI